MSVTHTFCWFRSAQWRGRVFYGTIPDYKPGKSSYNQATIIQTHPLSKEEMGLTLDELAHKYPFTPPFNAPASAPQAVEPSKATNPLIAPAVPPLET